MSDLRQPRAILFANTDWYLYNFLLPLARAVRDAGYSVHLVSPSGPYAARLSAEGFEWHAFQFDRHGVNPFAEIATIARLVTLYRSISPTHCHNFTIKCILYGSYAARRAGAAKVINTVSGRGYVFYAQSRRMALLRQPVLWLCRLLLRGTDVVFQNDDDRRAFVDAGMLGGARVHLVRGAGVDVDQFRPSAVRNFDHPQLSVLFASRLLWEKGVADVVEAARVLRERKINAVVRIAGEPDAGNPRSIPQATLDAWATQPGVELLGHRDDVAGLLAAADVVVLPSYGEGIPRILLEAAAAGLPLVATDVPGCREIVRPGENGILVPERDPVALADALQRLAQDPALRERMSARSRAIACNEFADEQVLAETLAIYREPVNA
jgi:glycosyltransferase involved in cell wall biosynthesis